MNLARAAFASLSLAAAASTGCAAEWEETDAAETTDVADDALKIKVDYTGHLKHVFCDVKQPLKGRDEHPVTDENYKAVLAGFKTLGCDGVRVYIDPKISDPAKYPAIYKKFYSAARKQGFRIYANPLDTGTFGKKDKQYADWISRWQKHYKAEYIGAFNEFGPDVKRLTAISARVKNSIGKTCTLVGPDAQDVSTTPGLLTPALLAQTEIVGSHNATEDESATKAGWAAIVKAAKGKEVWSSENPRKLSVKSASGKEIGIKAVLASKVTGLVLYKAFPNAVAENGDLREKGEEIAKAILAK